MGICRNWATAHFLAFMVGLGTIMALCVSQFAGVLQWESLVCHLGSI